MGLEYIPARVKAALDLRADPQNLPDGLTRQKWPADTFAQIGSGDYGRPLVSLWKPGERPVLAEMVNDSQPVVKVAPAVTPYR